MKHFNSQDARFFINTYGFSLFPIHGINQNGSCTCGNIDCKSPGKHPATNDGFKSASKDIEEIKKLWAGRTGLNVGIATGKASGVFVVDCDSEQAYKDLKEKINLPDTFTVKTGRGYHLYFAYDEQHPVKNGTKILDNVDIRGDGGYVAGPKSIHKNGNVYEIINPLEVFAEAPQELYDLLISGSATAITKKPPLVKPSLIYKNNGWSASDMQRHLTHINPDCDYDTWIKIGMALHEENAPFSVWDEWSKRGKKYDGSTADHWKSFKKGGGITYGTIVALAKERGWKPDVSVTHTPINKEKITQTNRQYYIKASEMIYEPNSDDFIQGLLTNATVSVVYGESNCGKTFFMTDLAFHVAENKSWREKRVEGGAVLYVALEGLYGLKGRIEAYKKEKGAKLDKFLVMPCPLDFLDADGDINDFLALLDKAKQDVGDIKLIVIDTLARAIGGGDENSGQDMGILVKHADAVRQKSGAHICFVHHSGKDKAKGARGHSSLRAAVDTEIEITRTEGADYSSVKIAKQRDLEIGEKMDFKLKQVELGKNKYGETVTSCVVETYDADSDYNCITKIKPGIRIAYDAFVECIGDKGRKIFNNNLPNVEVVTNEEFKSYLNNRGLLSEKESSARVQYSNYRKELIEQKLAVYRSGYLWIMDKNGQYYG